MRPLKLLSYINAFKFQWKFLSSKIDGLSLDSNSEENPDYAVGMFYFKSNNGINS
jgi:hypothetical protein